MRNIGNLDARLRQAEETIKHRSRYRRPGVKIQIALELAMMDETMCLHPWCSLKRAAQVDRLARLEQALRDNDPSNVREELDGVTDMQVSPIR